MRRSCLFTDSRSNLSGSNSPPTHSSISSCLRWSGLLIASTKSEQPQGPPQSSGGHALWPATQMGYFTPCSGGNRSSESSQVQAAAVVLVFLLDLLKHLVFLVVSHRRSRDQVHGTDEEQ